MQALINRASPSHTHAPAHEPAVSRATSESAEVCCGQRRVRRTRDAGGSQTNKSRSRPLSLTSEPHEARTDGFHQRRAAVAEECLAVCACVHAPVCLCTCAGVFVCMSVCIRAACVCVSARFCVDAPVCARARVCACRRVPVRACVPPDASRARQPACAAHDRRCAASMAVGSNGRISARDMPRRALVDGPSDAPVHASRRA